MHRKSNSVRTIASPLRIGIADDLALFDALSPRVREALNYAPIKLSASPRLLLLDDEEILALLAATSAELIRLNPLVVLSSTDHSNLCSPSHRVVAPETRKN